MSWGDSEMSERGVVVEGAGIKAVSFRPDDLSLILRIHVKVEREHQLQRDAFWPLPSDLHLLTSVLWSTHVPHHAHTQSHINNNFYWFFFFFKYVHF